MIISICKTLEVEFLKLKPYFKYCFSKDTRRGNFKEYNFKINRMCLKKNLEYQKRFKVFQDLSRKETLKIHMGVIRR